MKSSIYTRTGDSGTTQLVDGQRTSKASARLEAYGTVDELNSFIGVLIASNPLTDNDRILLTSIQNTLFDIGAYLATAEPALAAKMLPDLMPKIEAMEAEIDTIDGALPRHNKFILPQGTPSAAAAHVARTVARRAERRIVSLSDEAPVDSSILRYVNRLSDYLFVLARHCNNIAASSEIFWQK